jgi:hypothetical protein
MKEGQWRMNHVITHAGTGLEEAQRHFKSCYLVREKGVTHLTVNSRCSLLSQRLVPLFLQPALIYCRDITIVL